MPLSDTEAGQYRKQLTEFIELYRRVKFYVIASEKAAEGDKISLPAINELRNAFDHLMCASAVYYGLSTVPPESGALQAYDYCHTNMSKGMGHLYRAGYDVLDVISLSRTSDIQRILASVRHTTLVAVFHSYSADIRMPLEQAVAACDKAKASKDVESNDAGQQHFQKYEEAIRTLDQVRARLYDNLPELTKVDQEKKQEKEKDSRTQRNWAIVGMVAAIIVAAITLFLSAPWSSGKKMGPQVPAKTSDSPAASTATQRR